MPENAQILTEAVAQLDQQRINDTIRRVRRNQVRFTIGQRDDVAVPEWAVEAPPTTILKKKPLKESKEITNDSTTNRVFGLYSSSQEFPRAVREGMLLSLPPAEFPYDHCVGIEIEVEDVAFGANPQATKLYQECFNTHGDGSLRNGIEFITRYGITAGDALSYLPVLNTLLTAGSGKCEFSFRCGLHIHVDVIDHSLEELYRVFLLYSVVEPLLFEISGNRQNNKFCVAVQQSVNAVTDAIYFGHSEEWQKFAEAIMKGTKYMAMNVLPVRRFGTIEFRHHEGTCDTERIKNWLLPLFDLVVGTKKLNTKELENRILLLNNNCPYEAFLKDVFPNSYHLLSKDRSLREKMYKSVAFIKEIFVAGPETVDLVRGE